MVYCLKHKRMKKVNEAGGCSHQKTSLTDSFAGEDMEKCPDILKSFIRVAESEELFKEAQITRRKNDLNWKLVFY